MTEQNQAEEATVTIGDTTYPISELSDQVKELISLHEQALQMTIAAKRQAAIHEMSVSNIAALVEKAVSEETDE